MGDQFATALNNGQFSQDNDRWYTQVNALADQYFQNMKADLDAGLVYQSSVAPSLDEDPPSTVITDNDPNDGVTEPQEYINSKGVNFDRTSPYYQSVFYEMKNQILEARSGKDASLNFGSSLTNFHILRAVNGGEQYIDDRIHEAMNAYLINHQYLVDNEGHSASTIHMSNDNTSGLWSIQSKVNDGSFGALESDLKQEIRDYLASGKPLEM